MAIYTLKEWKQRHKPKVVILQPDFDTSRHISDALRYMLADREKEMCDRFDRINKLALCGEIKIPKHDFFKIVST